MLPREDGTFQVWHHGQVATVSRCDTSHIVGGTVRVAWIARVVIFRHDVIVLLSLGQTEVAFSVSHPQTELAAAQRAEHHALVLRNLQGDELTLELVAHIVQHLCIVLRIGHSVVIVDETQFHHQLTAVADAE